MAIRAEGISKSYPGTGPHAAGLTLFQDVSLEVAAGEVVAIVGRSGAGKSSLLHLLAGLDKPSAGQVWVGGVAMGPLSGADLASLRNRAIGFVWQFHYLLPEFTALENVAMPLRARGLGVREAESEARKWVERVELGARAAHRSGELSGGEQQRVAIARALVTKPAILLADEPTGDLDEQTASALFDLLQRLCREQGLGALLVTHNTDIAGRCDRVLSLAEGRLVAGLR